MDEVSSLDRHTERAEDPFDVCWSAADIKARTNAEASIAAHYKAAAVCGDADLADLTAAVVSLTAMLDYRLGGIQDELQEMNLALGGISEGVS